jgi:hypothetical protein
MRLVDFAVGDFQSYHELQELTFDPQLTLSLGGTTRGSRRFSGRYESSRNRKKAAEIPSK